MAYARTHRPWAFDFVEQGRGDPPPKWLANWDGDGILARIENRPIAAAVARSRLPTVDLSAARLVPALPWVETNDAVIGKFAADHLIGAGLRHFGFCGDARFNWSKWRGEQFERALRVKGFACSVYQPLERKESLVEEQTAAIARWLRTLPLPAGILACYDIRAQQVLEASREAGLSVPGEIAVVGVDNDELLCELCTPPLSSVQPNQQLAGYEAARLLDRMMHGHRPASTTLLIDPLRLVVRQSSDVLAVHDSEVAAALKYIRQHACESIDVSDVLRAVPVSRRVLESRFRRLLGGTPHQEIVRARLERVKQLLIETNQTLAQIARLTGFEHVEYLSVVFKREVGTLPSRFRANARKALPSN
jgi:LacI family transcriptional regulator